MKTTNKHNKTLRPWVKVALSIICIVVFFSVLESLQTYKMNGVIIEDNGSSVTVETTNGHLWEVLVDYNTFQEGDEVVVEIADRGNPNKIGDDEVINISHRR
jgi:hypothetical protein